MKYYKKLVGKKVYLSPMNVEDAEVYVKWLNDFNVTDGLGTSNGVVSLEAEKQWITNNSNQNQFAIVRLEDDKLIGNCGIHNLDQSKQCAEVGLFIGDEENRNKGYGQDVLNLLLYFGFNYLNLNNIMLKVFSFNEAAINCYKKVGFKEIGRRRQSYYLKGTFYDDVNEEGVLCITILSFFMLRTLQHKRLICQGFQQFMLYDQETLYCQ